MNTSQQHYSSLRSFVYIGSLVNSTFYW